MCRLMMYRIDSKLMRMRVQGCRGREVECMDVGMRSGAHKSVKFVETFHFECPTRRRRVSDAI